MPNRVLYGACILALVHSSPVTFSNALAAENAYDDPAVAACEFTRLRGKKPSDDTYKRVLAKIDGMKVEITFETSPLNTKPRQDSYSCDFSFNGTEFTLMREDSREEYKKCAAIFDEITSGTREMPKTNEGRDREMDLVTRCQDVLLNSAAAEMTNLIEIDLSLTQMGIYPIKPEDTALRP